MTRKASSTLRAEPQDEASAPYVLPRCLRRPLRSRLPFISRIRLLRLPVRRVQFGDRFHLIQEPPSLLSDIIICLRRRES